MTEDQLAALAGSKVFTKLDLFKGYHQLWRRRLVQKPLSNGEHYKVLQFGPKNAPVVLGDKKKENQ
jgi:hypothetical protein